MKAVLLLQLAFFACVGVALASLVDHRCQEAASRATAVMLTHVPMRELGEIGI